MILHPDYFSAFQSKALLAFSVFLSLGSIAVVSFRYWKFFRLRQVAQQTKSPESGDGVLLTGVVESSAGSPSKEVLSVEIDQQGANYMHKNGDHHTWTETARRIQYQPFLLRTDDDELVRVVPDPGTQLLHPFVIKTTNTNAKTRTKHCSITVGTRVVCIGHLSAVPKKQENYRDRIDTPILTAGTLGHLLLSDVDPTEYANQQLRTHGIALALALVCSLSSLVLIPFPYLSLLQNGQVIELEPQRAWQREFSQKHGVIHRYFVSGTSRDYRLHGVTFTSQIPRENFLALNSIVGEHSSILPRRSGTNAPTYIPFVVDFRSVDRHYAGDEISISHFRGGMMAFLSLITAFIVIFVNGKQWFDGAKENDEGNG